MSLLALLCTLMASAESFLSFPEEYTIRHYSNLPPILSSHEQNRYWSIPRSAHEEREGTVPMEISIPAPLENYVWHLSGYYKAKTTGSHDFTISETKASRISVGQKFLKIYASKEDTLKQLDNFAPFPYTKAVYKSSHYPVVIEYVSTEKAQVFSAPLDGIAEFIYPNIRQLDRTQDRGGTYVKHGFLYEVYMIPEEVEPESALGSYSDMLLLGTGLFDQPNNNLVLETTQFPHLTEIVGHIKVLVSGKYYIKMQHDFSGALQVGPPIAAKRQEYSLTKWWKLLDSRYLQSYGFMFDSSYFYPFRIVISGDIRPSKFDVTVIGPENDKVDLFGITETFEPEQTATESLSLESLDLARSDHTDLSEFDSSHDSDTIPAEEGIDNMTIPPQENINSASQIDESSRIKSIFLHTDEDDNRVPAALTLMPVLTGPKVAQMKEGTQEFGGEEKESIQSVAAPPEARSGNEAAIDMVKLLETLGTNSTRQEDEALLRPPEEPVLVPTSKAPMRDDTKSLNTAITGNNTHPWKERVIEISGSHNAPTRPFSALQKDIATNSNAFTDLEYLEASKSSTTSVREDYQNNQLSHSSVVKKPESLRTQTATGSSSTSNAQVMRIINNNDFGFSSGKLKPELFELDSSHVYLEKSAKLGQHYKPVSIEKLCLADIRSESHECLPFDGSERLNIQRNEGDGAQFLRGTTVPDKNYTSEKSNFHRSSGSLGLSESSLSRHTANSEDPLRETHQGSIYSSRKNMVKAVERERPKEPKDERHTRPVSQDDVESKTSSKLQGSASSQPETDHEIESRNKSDRLDKVIEPPNKITIGSDRVSSEKTIYESSDSPLRAPITLIFYVLSVFVL